MENENKVIKSENKTVKEKKVKDDKFYYKWYTERFGGLCKFLLPSYFFGEDFPQEPSYIVSNHLTLFDPVLIYVNTDGFKRFVSKQETKKIPVLGRIFAKIGTIFIDRSEKGDLGAVKNILKSSRKGETIVIYPEGTRNKENTEIQPLKDGISMFVLKSSPIVVPVALYNRQRFFRRNFVYVGKPIDFSEYKIKQGDSATIMEEVKQLIYTEMLRCKQVLDGYIQAGGAKKLKALYKKQKKENKKLGIKNFVIKVDDLQ